MEMKRDLSEFSEMRIKPGSQSVEPERAGPLKKILLALAVLVIILVGTNHERISKMSGVEWVRDAYGAMLSDITGKISYRETDKSFILYTPGGVQEWPKKATFKFESEGRFKDALSVAIGAQYYVKIPAKDVVGIVTSFGTVDRLMRHVEAGIRNAIRMAMVNYSTEDYLTAKQNNTESDITEHFEKNLHAFYDQIRPMTKTMEIKTTVLVESPSSIRRRIGGQHGFK